jgi:hypothetical protein
MRFFCHAWLEGAKHPVSPQTLVDRGPGAAGEEVRQHDRMSTRHKISGVVGIVVGIGKICSTIARRTNSRSICKQQVTCVQCAISN